MSAHLQHDLDELSELLDGRLDEERRRAVEDRLRSCAECRAAHAALSWTRAEVQRLSSTSPGPSEALDEALRAALDRAVTRPPAVAARRASLLVLAAVLVAVLAAFFIRPHREPASLPEAAAAVVSARAGAQLRLELEASDPRAVEAYFASARLGFPTRVFDLAMMGYDLQGGLVDHLAGRRSALSVYRDRASGREVLCQMLREGLAALPPAHEQREHDGIRFALYHLAGITVVFWEEGEVLCVLAGAGNSEGIVQLAFAKAMKARVPPA